ncbi:cupin domain-containing protein [Virgibacillus xinjiangensis]|uniref:Cupin domain-containing protein n=1 Tax=Virgibacillus xinjiangensis TaxID=393090 RepID=A0ABV7CW77_9BACI
MVGSNHQTVEAILEVIKGEAEAIDLYNRLANSASEEQKREEIFGAMQHRTARLHHLNDLYISMTGRVPVYQLDRVPFNSFDEGVQKAYHTVLKNGEANRKAYLMTQSSPISEVFLRAYHEETGHAERFSSLSSNHPDNMEYKDYGGQPFVINIEEAAENNNTFRTAIWTGEHLQVTVMSIDVGDDIGLEVHPTVDQFLRIEEGQGLVQMGDTEEQLDFQRQVSEDYAIMVPAGKWHNLTNTGRKPLKLYTIYAPPEHPFGTVHMTKEDAMAAEEG